MQPLFGPKNLPRPIVVLLRSGWCLRTRLQSGIGQKGGLSNMGRVQERRILQLSVALASLVPVAAGAAGVVTGPNMAADIRAHYPPDLESHFRYLSGLLLGVGIAFAASIPTIERRSELFALLSGVVVVGGLVRLGGLLIYGMPGAPHFLSIGMELIVVPLLFVWQRKVAYQFRF